MPDCWMRTPPPLFSFCLWMCFAAGAVPMWLKLQKVIKELQEEKKVSGDRLFLFWINRKTTRERFLPPVSTAMSFIPIWKSFELMYMHRTRRTKIYSDHVTKTIPPSLLKIPAKENFAGVSRLPSSWISKFIYPHPMLFSFLSQFIVIPLVLLVFSLCESLNGLLCAPRYNIYSQIW